MKFLYATKHTGNGTVRAWSFRRLPEDKRWDQDMIRKVKGTPSGHEIEMRITANPIDTEPMDKPQPKPVTIPQFSVGNRISLTMGIQQDAKAAEQRGQEAGNKHTMNIAGREH